MKWPRVPIGDLCLPTETKDPREEADQPFLYVDIASIDRQLKTIGAFSKLLGAEAPSRARKVIQANDVLVSTVRPNLNAVAIVPHELDGQIASTGFCVLRPQPGVLHHKFLFYFTVTPEFVDELSSRVRGAHYPAVSDGDVKKLAIPLPPLSEQRRIVEILDQADALRKKRAEADAKAARILPALFYKMFGDPATNPKGWPISRLGDLCEVVSGATPRTDQPRFWDGGILWATPKDLSQQDEWILERTERTISQEGLSSCATRLLPEGAVLLSSRAPIGLVAVAGRPMCTNQGLKSLVCREKVDGWYLFAWCKLRANYLQNLGRGATFTEISKAIVESVCIPVPPLGAQRTFRTLLLLMEKLRRQARASRDSLELLFQALLQRAFTGDLTARWRLAHMKELLAEMDAQARTLEAVE